MNQFDLNKDGKVEQSELNRVLEESGGLSIKDLRKIKENKRMMSAFENFLAINPQMLKDFLEAYKEVAKLEKYKEAEQNAVISKTKEYLSTHETSIRETFPVQTPSLSDKPLEDPTPVKPVLKDQKGIKHAKTDDVVLAEGVKLAGSDKSELRKDIEGIIISDIIKPIERDQKEVVLNKYLSGINLERALQIIANPTKKEQYGDDQNRWKQAGYDLGFWAGQSVRKLARLEKLYHENDQFRVLADQYANTKSVEGNTIQIQKANEDIMANITEEKIFAALSNMQNDRPWYTSKTNISVDNRDEGTTHGKDLLSIFEELNIQNPSRLYASISFLFKTQGYDLNIKNRKELYEAVRQKPQLIKVFHNAINHLNNMGVDAFRAIKDGPNAIQKHFEERVKLRGSKESIISKMLESSEYQKMEKDLESKTQVALNEGVDGLKKYAKTLTGAEKQSVEDMIKHIESSQTKKSFMDRVKLEGINLLISTVEKKEGGFLGVDFSNKDINKMLSKATGDIVKAMKISFGVGAGKGGVAPGVGLSIVYGKEFGDLSVGGQAGVFMMVPYATMSLAYQRNSDSIRRAGLEDFDITAKKLGINGNIAWIGSITGGASIGISSDRLEGINQKQKQFTEFMDRVFHKMDTSKSSVETLQTIKDRLLTGAQDVDKPYLDKIIKKLETTFSMYGYDNMSSSAKKEFLDQIGDAYVKIWYESTLIRAQAEGYQFHSLGFGFQLLAGYFPLPLVYASMQKIKLKYEKDEAATFERSLKRYEGIGGDDQIPGSLDELVSSLSGLLKTTGVKIIKTPEGLIRLSGNPTVFDTSLNIRYNSSVSSQIKYENGSLVIGNVGTIKEYTETKDRGNRYKTLIIGSNGEKGTQILDENNINQFGSNNPTKIDFNSAREGGTLIGGRDADFDKLIYSNLDKFPGMNHIKGYVEFKKAYNAFEYPKAREILVKMLNAKGLKTLSASLAKVEEAKLPYVLGQINAAIMTDSSTKDKIASDETYANSISVKILELKKYGADPKIIATLEETNADKSKYQFNKSKIDAAITRYKNEAFVQDQAGGDETNKHSSKIVKVLEEINSMFKPLKDVLSNRTNTFKGITESVKLPEIMNLREEWIRLNGDKTNMEEKPVDNAFGLMATYKRGSGYKGFDKQIGVVSVVGQPVEVADPKVREFMVRGYGEKNLGKFLGSYDTPENREKLIQHMVDPSRPLVINGQEISFSGIRFVFNGGGRCFNESLIMQIPKSITIGGKTSGLSLTTDGSSDLYLAEGESSIIGAAFTTGNKIPVKRRPMPIILLQEKKKEPEPQPEPKPEESKPAPKVETSSSSGGGGGGGGNNNCPPASANTTGSSRDSGTTTGSTSPSTSPSGSSKAVSK